MNNLRAVDKPEPPSWSDIDDEERARKALAALGLDEEEVNRSTLRVHDLVFDSLVRLWKSLKRQPKMLEIWEDSGLKRLDYRPNNVNCAMTGCAVRAGWCPRGAA